MNIDAINTFLLLCETASFSQVAQKSNLTQSTISSRIKVLEDHLDAKLFERTPTGVFPTSAGKKFYGYAATMRETWQQGKQEVARSQNTAQSFGLGVHMSMWQRFLPGWIVLMREQYSQISIRVETDYSERLVDYLLQGVLDVAIIHMPTVQQGLEIKPFIEDQLVMVSRKKRSFSDCSPTDYVFVDWSYGYREEHAEKLPDFSTSPMNFGYGEIALSYLRVTDAFAYMPLAHVTNDLENQKLFLVENAPVLSRPSYLVHLKNPKDDQLLVSAIEGLYRSIDAF
ncbi:MAG: LysR family transcriptional regulator [Pseudomonadota bacterium]